MNLRWKIIALSGLGVALSLGAGFGSYSYTRALEAELSGARQSLRAFGDLVEIPVPLRDQTRGDALRLADFGEVRLPARYVPQNVLSTLPELTEGVSLVAMADLKAGQLIRADAVTRSDAPRRQLFQASLDNHVFAVAPRNLDDFGSLLQQGQLVDLIWSRRTADGSSESRLIGTGLTVRALPQTAPTPDPALPPGARAPESDAASQLSDSAPTDAALSGPGMSQRLLLEGRISDAMRTALAEDGGWFHILITDPARSLGADEVVIGPRDLAELPLIVRGVATASPAPVVIDATGQAPGVLVATSREPGQSGIFNELGTAIMGEQRKVCTTALVRGGQRQLTQVPC